MVKVSGAPGSFVVEGAFGDDASARQGVMRLRAAGISDGSIRFARRNAAAAPTPTPTFAKVFWTGFWWSVAGGLIGAMIGLIVGLLGIGFPGTPSHIAVQVASWAMFLHVAGALAGCYAALDTGDRFARSSHHHDADEVVVRVLANDAGEREQAAGILTEAGARFEG